MSDTHDIQIHTAFSSLKEPPTPNTRLRWLGVLTFVAALGWLYITWVPMYKWVHQKMVIGELNLAATLSNQNAEAAQNGGLSILSGIVNPDSANVSPRTNKPKKGSKTSEAIAKESQEKTERQEKAKVAAGVIAGLAVTWLGSASFVGMWLAMSSAAAVCSGLSSIRKFGGLLIVASLLAIIGLAWYVWQEYEWYETIIPGWVKPSMLGLAIVCAASIGTLLNRRGLWLYRTGGVLVILSALVSIGTILAAIKWGQMPADQIENTLYIKVFAVQSAYGWIILLSAIGLKKSR